MIDAQAVLGDMTAAIESAGTCRFEVTVRENGEVTSAGRGELRLRPTRAARISVDRSDAPTEYLVIGPNGYSRPIGRADAKWTRLQDEDVDQIFGNVSLESLVASFDAGLESVTELGFATIDDVTVTKLSFAVATSSAPGAPDGTGPEEPHATTDYEVRLDPEARPRKVVFDQGDGSTAELEYSRWGEPVRVAAPAPGQVE